MLTSPSVCVPLCCVLLLCASSSGGKNHAISNSVYTVSLDMVALPALGSWLVSPVPVLVPPQVLASAATVLDGTAVVLFGGKGAGDELLRVSYSFDGSAWLALSPVGGVSPSARYGAAMLAVGARDVMLLGGMVATDYTQVADCWIGSLGSGDQAAEIRWVAQPRPALGARSGGVAVLWRGVAWHLGGWASHTDQYFNDVFLSNLSHPISWTKHTNAPWTPRQGFAGAGQI